LHHHHIGSAEHIEATAGRFWIVYVELQVLVGITKVHAYVCCIINYIIGIITSKSFTETVLEFG